MRIKHKTVQHLLALLLITAIPVSAVSQDHSLRLGELRSERLQPIDLPIYFSSDSAVTFIQFLFEYNSSELFIQSPAVELGSQAGNLSISIINDMPPFSPVNPGADKNILVQLSGAGTETIIGDSLEILRLNFVTLGDYGDTAGVWLDPTNGRTLFTTPSLTDIQDENLQLFDGSVTVQDLTPPSSSISSPVSGFLALSDSLVITGTAQDAGVGLKSVEVSVDSGQTWQTANNRGVQFDTWQYTWKNLAPGNYFLMSRAEDLNENLETVTTSIAGRVNAAPNAFDLLQPSNNTTIDTLNPTLVWQASADPDPGDQVSYQVILSTQSDFSDTVLTAQNLSNTSYTISLNLEYSQTYYWMVIATDTPGISRPSTHIFSFKIEKANTPPNAFSLSLPESGAVLDTLNPTLVWQASADPDPGDQVSYQVILSTQSDFSDTVAHTGGNSITATELVVCCNLQPSQTYFWKVIAKDTPGDTTESGPFSFTTTGTATNITGPNFAPAQFALLQNYPNPFNPSTTIPFHLPETQRVRIEIVNLSGRHLTTLLDALLPAGQHAARWHGRNERGQAVSSGVYFVRMVAGRFVQTRKVVFMQ